MKHDELQQILQNRFKGCPDAIIKRLMSISEAGLLDRDFASLPEDEKTLRYEKVYCPTEEEYNEINSMITELDASQKRLQVDYLRVSIILQDVECTAQNFDTAVRNGDFVEGLRELRVGLLAYYLIDDARKSFGFYGKDDEEIRELGRQLSPRTTFLAHMRNYISGHLDAVVLEKACQWGGFCIFTKDTMQDLDMSLFLINKYVLESAINCCIASKGDDKKVIGVDEIDLTYPPDYEHFMKFMSETYGLICQYLAKVRSKIVSQLQLYEGKSNVFKRAIWAGETDFKIT